ncbi:MAG: hypothetical protein O3B13_00830 [Planctomycetota bacterium]|nr:hypothetical protein [Planctomycetota bacterium]
MSTQYRASFIPACASFGPVFIVQGYVFRHNQFLSAVIGYAGALATSFALFTLYKMLSNLQARHRDNHT